MVLLLSILLLCILVRLSGIPPSSAPLPIATLFLLPTIEENPENPLADAVAVSPAPLGRRCTVLPWATSSAYSR